MRQRRFGFPVLWRIPDHGPLQAAGLLPLSPPPSSPISRSADQSSPPAMIIIFKVTNVQACMKFVALLVEGPPYRATISSSLSPAPADGATGQSTQTGIGAWQPCKPPAGPPAPVTVLFSSRLWNGPFPSPWITIHGREGKGGKGGVGHVPAPHGCNTGLCVHWRPCSWAQTCGLARAWPHHNVWGATCSSQASVGAQRPRDASGPNLHQPFTSQPWKPLLASSYSDRTCHISFPQLKRKQDKGATQCSSQTLDVTAFFLACIYVLPSPSSSPFPFPHFVTIVIINTKVLRVRRDYKNINE